MLSTGIAPESTFPGWLRPYVRNQPLSLVAETLRGFGSGHVALGNLAASRPGVRDGAGLRCDHAAAAEAELVMNERSMQASLVTQSWVQAGRLLTEWRRERAVLVGSLIVPVCLLLVYVVVLDERVHKITGVESVYALVPVCAVLSGVFGALSTSLGIAMERDSGLLSRMWVMRYTGQGAHRTVGRRGRAHSSGRS